MDKKIEGLLHFLFAVFIVILVYFFSSELSFLKEWGYLGAFLIALISSATLFLPAPAWALLLAMSSFLNPIWLGIAAGLGSGIGELTGYVAGEGVRRMLASKIKETAQIDAIVKKYGVFGVFALAFIPNPLFDVAGVVAGSTKIPCWQFLIACILGRTLRYILLALSGKFALTH